MAEEGAMVSAEWKVWSGGSVYFRSWILGEVQFESRLEFI